MAGEIVQTVPYSFDEIYTSLVEKLGNDAPYEGSNLAILITSMSYLVSMLNVNTAGNINEMLLPLARKRENILEGARLLGYEPSKKTGYRYVLTITLKNDILFENKIPIEKYSKFTSNGNDYYYINDKRIELYGSEGDTFVLEVLEGTLKTFNDEPALTQNLGTSIDPVTNNIVPTPYIDIPFTDVDDNGIELFLTYVDTYGQYVVDEKWTKSNTFMVDVDTTFKKEFLRIDNIDFKTPRLYFKYAGVGRTVYAGTTIKANVIVSKGSLGACGSSFEIADTNIAEFAEVSSFEILSQGSDEESQASIQRNAPLFFNTANRVITAGDYKVFCDRDNRVKVSQVWGGEDESPVRPGELWFTFLPETFTRSFTANVGNFTYLLDNALDQTNLFLEDSEIRSDDIDNPGVWDILDLYRIPTMKLHNRHPIILDCEFDLSILKYNITKSRAVVHEEIFNVIDTFFKENEAVDATGEIVDFVEKFDIEYFNSNLVKRIDSYLSDNSGFNITMINFVNLFEKNLSKETFVDQILNLSNCDIFINFGIPFEDIFNSSGELLTNRLPNITSTINANGVSGTLSADFSSASGDLHLIDIIEFPIKHSNGNKVIGKYTVFNGSEKFITVQLFVQDNTDERLDPLTGDPFLPTGDYLVSSLRRTDFTTAQKLSVQFYSPNFRTYKNTIPRLKRVSFN